MTQTEGSINQFHIHFVHYAGVEPKTLIEPRGFCPNFQGSFAVLFCSTGWSLRSPKPKRPQKPGPDLHRWGHGSQTSAGPFWASEGRPDLGAPSVAAVVGRGSARLRRQPEASLRGSGLRQVPWADALDRAGGCLF